MVQIISPFPGVRPSIGHPWGFGGGPVDRIRGWGTARGPGAFGSGVVDHAEGDPEVPGGDGLLPVDLYLCLRAQGVAGARGGVERGSIEWNGGGSMRGRGGLRRLKWNGMGGSPEIGPGAYLHCALPRICHSLGDS